MTSLDHDTGNQRAAMTHDAFAERDARRNEWLKAEIARREVAPLKYVHPKDGRTCIKCHEPKLTTKNTSGLCRDCWLGMSPKRRREWQEAQR